MKTQKYYIFFGHTSPDNYKRDDNYRLVVAKDYDKLIELATQWTAQNHTECSNCQMRIILGDEVKLIPHEKVISWRIEDEYRTNHREVSK